MFKFNRVTVYLLVMVLIFGVMVSNVLAEKVTINVANNLGWVSSAPLWSLAELAEEEGGLPGININKIEVPQADLIAKQILESKLHTGVYDVLQFSERMSAPLRPFMFPIQDFIKADPKWDFDQSMDLISPLAKRGWLLADGKIGIVPFQGNAQFGFYRIDFLTDPKERNAFKEQYGQELPQPDLHGMIKFENIDHFINVAKFFTRDTNNDGKIDLWGLVQPGKGSHGGCRFEAELLRAGLDFFDEIGHSSWGPAHPENKELVKAIAAYDQDLIFKYKVSPSYIISMMLSELMPTYYNGEAVMLISWASDYWTDVNRSELISKIGKTGTFDSTFLDYAFNKKPHEAGTYAGWWGWAISVDSKNKEAAYEFIKWTVDPNTCKKRLQYAWENFQGISLSGSKEVAEWGVKEGYVPIALYEAYKTARAMQTEFPELTNAVQIERDNHEKLLSREITPAEFVEITGNEIEKMMHEAGYF